MFEKEFEEYKNQPKWKGKIFMKDEEICFKDGIELGYNKANEWYKQNIDDIYGFIAEDCTGLEGMKTDLRKADLRKTDQNDFLMGYRYVWTSIDELAE